MHLCDLPPLVLYKILRYLDPSEISKIMNANRLMYKAVVENRKRLPKSPVRITIRGEKYQCYSITVSDKLNKKCNEYVLCKSSEEKQEKMEEEENARGYCSSETPLMFFTDNNEELLNKIGKFLDFILKQMDSTHHLTLALINIFEELLPKIPVYLNSYQSRLNVFHFYQQNHLSSASFCDMIASMPKVEKFQLFLPHVLIRQELFKIPQLLEAETVEVHPSDDRYTSLSLTDDDILLLSAKTIKLTVRFDFSPTFIRTFVEEFLTEKRAISNGISTHGKFNFFFVTSRTPLNFDEMFAGMDYVLLPPDNLSGYITRDDGEMLEFMSDGLSFQYRIIENSLG